MTRRRSAKLHDSVPRAQPMLSRAQTKGPVSRAFSHGTKRSTLEPSTPGRATPVKRPRKGRCANNPLVSEAATGRSARCRAGRDHRGSALVRHADAGSRRVARSRSGLGHSGSKVICLRGTLDPRCSRTRLPLSTRGLRSLRVPPRAALGVRGADPSDCVFTSIVQAAPL
jgi:hypothetical protein